MSNKTKHNESVLLIIQILGKAKMLSTVPAMAVGATIWHAAADI